ncbi:hypothetical protein [Oceanobacillus kapialis]|uniref:Replication protein n=1 Tax=Oceanobacillus kapialis TaxID=481353 RepID=A0ABW5PZW3_9BACI
MNTWFKVYRDLFESDLWNDVTTFRLFILLIGKASHQDGVKVAGVELKKGQYLRSYRKLADDLSYKEGRGKKQYSIRTIHKAINKLISDGRVSKEETEQGTLFTVVNYAKYQDLTETNKKTGNETENELETFGKRSVNNNKNYKNYSIKESNKRDSRKQVYDDTSIYFQLAVFFFEQIKKNNPDHKEPNFQTWSNDIRKMIELDKRTEEQVQYLMKWVQQDEFEMTNVLSPAKLRKRFDQLVMKVKRDRPPSNVTPIDKKKYNYGF